MNCGKSMFLLATAYNFQERGVNFLILKSTIDTRDKGVIKSRSLGQRTCISITPEDSILDKVCENKKIISWIASNEARWILVDEAQFLTEKQVDDLAILADDYDFNVICYGLRTDFKTHLFEGSRRLMEIADTIEEIKSMCSCGKKNIVNARVNDKGEIVTDGEQIEVGAEEKYIAICRKCYNNKINKK